MTEQETKDFALGIIRDEFAVRGIKLHTIILFGSRALGNASPGSDWDFIVVCKGALEREEKKDVWLKINRKLSEYRIDADVLIKSVQDFEKDKLDTGKVTYYAVKHGMPV